MSAEPAGDQPMHPDSARASGSLLTARILIAVQAPAWFLPVAAAAIGIGSVAFLAYADGHDTASFERFVALALASIVAAGTIPGVLFFLTFHKRAWAVSTVATFELLVGLSAVIAGLRTEDGFFLVGEGALCLLIVVLLLPSVMQHRQRDTGAANDH